MELREREAAQQGKPVRHYQVWVPYTRISPNLKRAVLVAEDDAFWQHEGVDMEQLKISIRNDIEKGQAIRGGSTITQQLAKNLYLSPSRDPIRKLRELIIARRLEAELSKARIFEIYLNLLSLLTKRRHPSNSRKQPSAVRRPRCRDQRTKGNGGFVLVTHPLALFVASPVH